MDSSSEHSSRKTSCNVLALDGGGVRGLSSLLILQDLMRHINDKIRHQRHGEETHDSVEPRDIFDFVVGTSTGGLIAIMLGKLRMTLQESIQAYHDLSRNIFGKRHIIGRVTHGLAPTRYSGSHLERCVQKLIEKRQFPRTVPMLSGDDSDDIACAVICREHDYESKYAPIKEGAVPICSLRCPRQVECLVSEAARATSAAPTFFPVQRIGDRYFVDGGMEYNNPSFAIYQHYTESKRVVSSKRTSVSITDCHGRLDFSRVRFVNIGTGDKSKDLPPRQRDQLANLVPGFIRMTLFLKRTLTEFTVSSGQTAYNMETLVQVAKGDIDYKRFSADTGVCYIKMDKYKKLRLIEDLTSKYLKNPEIQKKLESLGEKIASDYLLKHP